jgi:hypothetical protein
METTKIPKPLYMTYDDALKDLIQHKENAD